MRTTKTPLIAVLAIFATLGLSAPAQAVPAVDQYTEQLPDPGGDKPFTPTPGDKNPGKKSQGGNDSGGSATYSGATTPGSVPVTGAVGSEPTGIKAKKNKKKRDRQKAEAMDGKPHEAGQDEATNANLVAAVPGEGSDGGGMGWVFPAMLVSVAGVVVGFTVGRRRGSAQAR